MSSPIISVQSGQRSLQRNYGCVLLFSFIMAANCLIFLLLMGCAAVQNSVALTPGVILRGAVRSGQQPISGSVVQLYAAGVKGIASESVSLISSGHTDLDGSFAIPGQYTCPSAASLLYLVARGGNPGLSPDANNHALALMTAVGPCNTLSSSASITVDEETTIASVFTLASYMRSSSQLGAALTDVQQFSEAFSVASHLAQGSYGPATSNVSVGWDIADMEKAYTLAAILATCIDSDGGYSGDGTPCGRLFLAVTPTGATPPTDTIVAALSVAHPTWNVAHIFGLSSPPTPFDPLLTVSPVDWTLSLSRGPQGPQEVSPGLPADTHSSPAAGPTSEPKVSTTPTSISPPLPVAAGSSFTPVAPNACQSSYDQFYMAEPGVYAYWAMCEPGSNPPIFDYAGRFDLTSASNAWSSGPGTIQGGVPGPVPDGETAAQVVTGSSFVANQDIPLNTNQGTLAVWANTDSTNYPMPMVFLGAVTGQSGIWVSAITQSNGECFTGTFVNSSGSAFTTPGGCGYAPNVWHRVAFTWSSGILGLYVDGALASRLPYSGALDDTVFVYRLFPESGNTGKQMTLAKALISNAAWVPAQVAADYKPSLVIPPNGGVYVTSQPLGVIHRDVLGYADLNSDLSSSSLVGALKAGLSTMGTTAIRYANGSGGITADLENWRGGASCTATRGVTAPATNVSTHNNLDNFVLNVAQPLGVHLGYTVNYGTNPPACNGGGDPASNGSDLVAYANVQKHYGVRYWEIGNELYDGGGSETDFHPAPGDGASYASYEQAFYKLMKKKDKTILIGIPVADGVYSWLATWTLPAMQAASYDAVVYHSYPIMDPVTDGQTLYPERVASNISRIRGSLLALQTELLNVKKSPQAIWVTEWNSAVGTGSNLWSRQTMGAVMPMFATMELAEYMQAGVQYATWWAQGASNVCMRYNYDWNGESAYSWWDCGGTFLAYTGPLGAETVVGLVPGDVSPTGRAFQLLSQSGFVTEGEHMLRVVTDVQNAPWLAAYAATHGSSYAIILINRDRDNAHTVPIQLARQTAGQTVQHWTYGRAQYDQTQTGNWSLGPVTSSQPAWTSEIEGVLPPWSVNVFITTNVASPGIAAPAKP